MITAAVEFSWIAGSLHCTGEGLFSEEILWKVKLAGLVVDDSSGKLNPGNRVKLVVPTSILVYCLRSSDLATLRFQNRILPELLRQVNVIFPLSGTTYPPGMGRASAERLTVRNCAINGEDGQLIKKQSRFQKNDIIVHIQTGTSSLSNRYCHGEDTEKGVDFHFGYCTCSRLQLASMRTWSEGQMK